MHRGYLTPPVLIGLALLSLFVAATLLFNTFLIRNIKNEEILDKESKTCSTNEDCSLRLCTGCFNKEWVESAPPEPPCARYEGYTCECINQVCEERKLEPSSNTIDKTIYYTDEGSTTWKTYTSLQGRYSLKYPTSYKLLENKDRSWDGTEEQRENTAALYSDTAGDPPIRIVFEKVGSNLSLNELVDQKSWCVSITPDKGIKYEISDRPGLIFENNGCGVAGSTDLYVLNNSIFYHIDVRGGTWEVKEKFRFNQILSTFKFLN